MTRTAKAAVLLLVQVAMVLGIAGKARCDRESLPRVWVKTLPVDPEHPLRGRYVRLALQVDPCGWAPPAGMATVRLRIRDGNLCAEPAPQAPYGPTIVSGPGGSRLAGSVMYYIPEHADDPSRRAPGEELWVEVAVSEHGLPRPVRLGIRKEGGPVVPLSLPSGRIG